MKRVVTTAFALMICTVFAVFSVTAESYTLSDGIGIALPDGYTLLTPTNLNNHGETVASLDYTAQKLKKHMTDSGILFIAVDKDNKNQFQLKALKTDFSKNTVDLKNLGDSELKTIGEKLMSGNFETVSINGTVYYRAVTDGLSSYATVQYVTVKNGLVYTLSYYGASAPVAVSAAETLKIPDVTPHSDKTVLLTVFLWIALVAVLVTAVLLTLSLISDIRQSHEENDVREFIRIKRGRRF